MKERRFSGIRALQLSSIAFNQNINSKFFIFRGMVLAQSLDFGVKTRIFVSKKNKNYFITSPSLSSRSCWSNQSDDHKTSSGIIWELSCPLLHCKCWWSLAAPQLRSPRCWCWLCMGARRRDVSWWFPSPGDRARPWSTSSTVTSSQASGHYKETFVWSHLTSPHLSLPQKRHIKPSHGAMQS